MKKITTQLGGWMDLKVILRIAYYNQASKQKHTLVEK